MRRRRLVSALLRACHPEPTITVTAVATAFAATVGHGAGVAWVAVAVLAGQLSVGWSNDYIDRFRDAAVGRIDKPIVAGDVPARVVGAAAVVALVAALALSFAGGWRAAVVHAVALAAAWSYNLGVKATVLSPLPYAVGFAGLPSFVVLGLPGAPAPPGWLVLAGALLGMGAHFANVLPDLVDDIEQGVVGLPHRLGHRPTTLVAVALLLAASVVLAFGPASGPGVAGTITLVAVGVLVATVLLRSRAPSRLPFRVAMAIAVINTVLLVLRGPTVLG